MAARPRDGFCAHIRDLQEQAAVADRELLLSVLKLLHRDLYLERRKGRYTFRMGFLRRYWQLTRGLV